MSYRPSIKAFLLGLRLTFNGIGISDKIRLVLLHFLNSLIKVPIFRIQALTSVKKLIASKTLISFEGSRYAFIDNFGIFSYYHESWIWDYLKLKQGDVFIDVGANIGKYTILAAKIVKEKGRVIAIEPEPCNYEVLIKNISINKLRNVTAINCAAWDDDCKIKLYIGHDSEGHSGKITGHKWIFVKARKLDSLIDKLRLDKVDMIKIDVEGAEVEVLRGLEQTLNNYRPKLVIEVFIKNLDEVVRLLNKHGYRYNVIHGSEFFQPAFGVSLFAEPRADQI